MVTSKEGASDRSAADELQQKQDPGNGLHESKSNSERSSFLMLPKKPCSELQQSQSPQNVDTVKHASLSHQGISDTMVQDEVLHSGKMIHKRESTDLQMQNQDTGTGDCTSKADSEDPISILPKKESDDMQKRESTNSGVYVLHSNQEGSSLSVKTEIESDNLLQKQEETMLSAIPDVSEVLQERQGPINGVSTVQLEQVSVRSEKVLEKLPLRRKLESGINVLNSGQDGSITPRLPEKVSEDGYNWRKYGQKLVKGNEYIRSYYRCTHPNCLAKKQVERSHDGPIIDINYLGKHEHAKREHSPQVLNDVALSVQSRRQDETALPSAQDKPSNDRRMTLHQIEPAETLMSPNAAARNDVVGVAVSEPKRMGDEVDDDQNSKRQKRDILNVDVTPENKANSELHFVVQTMSEVDFINDGYRWRKYGQKLVKGNPNPRSYYRCSNTGCPAKKHVERASHDLKLVITTYKRQHDHEMPATRTMTHSTSDSNMNTTVENGAPRPKPKENGAASLDVVIHNGAN